MLVLQTDQKPRPPAPASLPFLGCLTERELVRLVDDGGACRPGSIDIVPHALQLFGRVPLPLRHLSDDAQRIAGAVGEGWISGESLVRQIGIVNHEAGRLNEVNTLRPFASGQFSAPNCGIERAREVYLGQRLPFAIVGCVASDYEISVCEIGTRSVEELPNKHAPA